MLHYINKKQSCDFRIICFNHGCQVIGEKSKIWGLILGLKVVYNGLNYEEKSC